MSDNEGSAEERPRWTRDEIIAAIGASIIDASRQFPPFPMVPSALAYSVAEEIYAKLRALDAIDEPEW